MDATVGRQRVAGARIRTLERQACRMLTKFETKSARVKGSAVQEGEHRARGLDVRGGAVTGEERG